MEGVAVAERPCTVVVAMATGRNSCTKHTGSSRPLVEGEDQRKLCHNTNHYSHNIINYINDTVQ